MTNGMRVKISKSKILDVSNLKINEHSQISVFKIEKIPELLEII